MKTDIINDERGLREIYFPPADVYKESVSEQLTPGMMTFIENSPFCLLGSVGKDGFPNISPRGGKPGFVHIVNDRRVAIRDEKGNNKIESYLNLVDNPHIYVIFLVPRYYGFLRARGTAVIQRDQSAGPGRTTLFIDITQAYMHCGKALVRSDLWNPQQWQQAQMPSIGAILAEMLGRGGDYVKRIDAFVENDLQTAENEPQMKKSERTL